MIIDWLWALITALGIVLEAVGWFSVTSFLFPREKRYQVLFLAAVVAIMAQFYFALSLTPLSGPLVHLILLCLGLLGSTLFFQRKLAIKRKFITESLSGSPKIIQFLRAHKFWILLPVIWIFIHIFDALIPHPSANALSVHLQATHRWLEQRGQMLSPLLPREGLTSIWDGLYFHAHGILHAFGFDEQSTLVRVHLTSQLLHFILGQLLTIALLTEWIHRNPQTVFSTPLVVSFFFAWIACAQPSIAVSSTNALDHWGISLFLFSSLVAALDRRYLLAFFLSASAISIDRQTAFCSFAILLVMFFTNRSILKKPRYFIKIALALSAGASAWMYRNFTQTGLLFYPWQDHHSSGSGWLAHDVMETLIKGSTSSLGFGITLLLLLGCVSLLIYFSKRGFKFKDRTIPILVLFTLINFRVTHVLVISLALISIWSLEVTANALLRWNDPKPFYRSRTLFWFLIALISVPIPIHIFWQNASIALNPATEYLEKYHQNFRAKKWISDHYSPTTKVAWTKDNQHYYLDAVGISIADSNLIQGTLRKASTPSERTQVLCQLGFQLFASEDVNHGGEVVGLFSWLKTVRAPVVYSDLNLTLFDLGLICKKLGSERL